LGISDEKQDADERHAQVAEPKPRQQTAHLLGRDIPVATADPGTLRAEDDGKPASAKSMQPYVARAFGDRLDEARGAMEALPPKELNRIGFRLCESWFGARAPRRPRARYRPPGVQRTDGRGTGFT
jgi:hypothetical protein